MNPQLSRRNLGLGGMVEQSGKITAAQLSILEGSGQGQPIAESESSVVVFQGMRWVNKDLDEAIHGLYFSCLQKTILKASVLLTLTGHLSHVVVVAASSC